MRSRPRSECEFPQDLHRALASRRHLDIYIDDVQPAPRPQRFDVTAISQHTQLSTRSRLRFPPKYALKTAKESKRTRFGNLCPELDMDLRPTAFDTYGTGGPGTELGLDRIAWLYCFKRGSNPHAERVKLYEYVSPARNR